METVAETALKIPGLPLPAKLSVLLAGTFLVEERLWQGLLNTPRDSDCVVQQADLAPLSLTGCPHHLQAFQVNP